MHVKLWSFSLVNGLAMAAFGCAGPGSSSDSMELVLKVPGLEIVEPVTHDIKNDSQEIVTLYTWNASGTRWPQAYLVFLRLKDVIRQSLTYVGNQTLPEQIENFFPRELTTLGASGRAENVLGELRFQRFQREGSGDCIFIEQGVSRYSDSEDVDGPWPPLGDMVVRGWYCMAEVQPSPSPAFRGFIAGIGIRGWALPYGVTEYSRPAAVASKKPADTSALSTAAVAPAFEPGTFDGKGEGVMSCGSCVNCIGPLEKPVVVTIEHGYFKLSPDLAYQGTGTIDGSGRMRIRRWPTRDNWGIRLERDFDFDGDFDGEKFNLSGVRGPRSCRITLHQADEIKVRQARAVVPGGNGSSSRIVHHPPLPRPIPIYVTAGYPDTSCVRPNGIGCQSHSGGVWVV